MRAAPRVEPLGPHHDRAAFSCGEPALDGYIGRQALQDVRRRVAQVFVAVGAEPHVFTGYYSLSAASFRRDELPEALARRLPRYPVPAKLGQFLLLDAVRRVLGASAAVAVYAVVVEAKNEQAQRFYERFGFEPFPNTRHRLFLPLDTFV